VSQQKGQIEEKELKSWKLLAEFRKRLAEVKSKAPPEEKRLGGPERLLLEEDYFSLVLFGMLNPALDSMRGLCAASKLQRVQEEVCSRPVSLGSFSEAQAVFDPELLREVFLTLVEESQTSWGDDRLKHLKNQLALIDGSLLPALPRMHWALWLDEKNRAAKLHLKFSVLRNTPSDARITQGNECERKVLKELVKKGETIVGDRYYGLDYGYFSELADLGASYVIRIRNTPKMETVEELSITDADRKAGVTWQGKVNLGDKWKGEPIRVVKVEIDGKTLLIVTDLELEAELISLIYRYRWQVELFFKWLKSILGCRHLIAESPAGVAIQIYTALIAALMLQAFVGKRPSKRAMEMIQMYMTGYATIDELMQTLGIEEQKKNSNQ